MQFLPVFELSLVGVADAAVPNRERIVLRPTETVNLAQFSILLGLQNNQGVVTPLNDAFFWFGELLVAPPSWLVVYTGAGEFLESRMPVTGEKAYSFHWGRLFTAFGLPNVVPVVCRIGSILVGSPPLRLPPPLDRKG